MRIARAFEVAGIPRAIPNHSCVRKTLEERWLWPSGDCPCPVLSALDPRASGGGQSGVVRGLALRLVGRDEEADK